MGRFQQSCAMEGMGPMRGPMGPPPPQMMMQPPQMTEEMMMMCGGMQDELSLIEQDLNMTRRATRPFIPQEDVSYFELQKQIHELETLPNAPIRPVRFNADEFLSIDQLPPPKKTQPKPEPEPERPRPQRSDKLVSLIRSPSGHTCWASQLARQGQNNGHHPSWYRVMHSINKKRKE